MPIHRRPARRERRLLRLLRFLREFLREFLRFLREFLREFLRLRLRRPPTLRLLRDARRLRLFLRLRTTPTTPPRILFAPENTPFCRRLTPDRPLCFTDLTTFRVVFVSPLTAFSPALGIRATRVKIPLRRPPRRFLRVFLRLFVRFAIFLIMFLILFPTTVGEIHQVHQRKPTLVGQAGSV